MPQKQIATRINSNLFNSLKMLGVKKEKPVNQLAIRNLLKKHGQKIEK